MQPATLPSYTVAQTRYADVQDPERALRDIVKRGEDGRQGKALVELNARLEAARSAGDAQQVQQLTAKLIELKQQRLGIDRSDTTAEKGEKPE